MFVFVLFTRIQQNTICAEKLNEYGLSSILCPFFKVLILFLGYTTIECLKHIIFHIIAAPLFPVCQ